MPATSSARRRTVSPSPGNRQTGHHPPGRDRRLRGARLLQRAGRRRGQGRRCRGGNRLSLLPQQGRPAGLDLRADREGRASTKGAAAVVGHVGSGGAAAPFRPPPSRACSAAIATLPSSFQVELRQSVKFMERFSSTLLQDYLGQIRWPSRTGRRRALFRRDINATIGRQDVLRRTRRDGDKLDAQPPAIQPRVATPTRS